MNKTALITGTTSGIGKSIAHKFAREKCHLILVSRNGEKLEEQAKVLSGLYGVKVDTITADLLEENSAQRIFDLVQAMNRKVQILVNNAGFNEYGCFMDTRLEKEMDMITLHALRTTEMMKLFLPTMIQNREGYVLNVGSTGSYMACPWDAVYAGTKAYILTFSKGIHAELKGTGVSVTTLCPGSTDTQFAAKAGMENTFLFKMFVMDPDFVANIGYKALFRRKSAVIAGKYNQIMVFFSKIIPSSVLNWCIKFMLQSG